MSDQAQKFECWGICELMGHQRVAGRIGERAIGGGNLLQVDVPQADDSFRTVFYGNSAIYALHVTDEAAARACAKVSGTRPTYAWELESASRRLPAPAPESSFTPSEPDEPDEPCQACADSPEGRCDEHMPF